MSGLAIIGVLAALFVVLVVLLTRKRAVEVAYTTPNPTLRCPHCQSVGTSPRYERPVNGTKITSYIGHQSRRPEPVAIDLFYKCDICGQSHNGTRTHLGIEVNVRQPALAKR